MFSKAPLIAVAAVLATTFAAQAAPIDFSSVLNTQANPQTVPELSISTAAPGATIAIAPIVIDGSAETIFCAVDTAPTCANDLSIAFTTPVNDLKFSVGDTVPATPTTETDLVTISAFDAMNNLLLSFDVTSADVFASTPDANGIYSFDVDLSGLFEVATLTFDDKAANPTATGGYFYYGLEASPIPLPAALPLMALGLGALGIARSRKRKAA